MQIPVMSGVIDRRILVNFRVDPEYLKRVLPDSMTPKVVGEFGIGGICLIRLRNIRPRFLPAWLGVESENAAHRIAVEWAHEGVQTEGVYIPRRDTSSLVNALSGGRLFPGRHYLASFRVHEQADTVRVEVRSRSGEELVRVDAEIAAALPQHSVFRTLEDASSFFERGSIGYSASDEPGKLDGLQLRTHSWAVRPLNVRSVYSRFFEDERVFPKGAVDLDNALLMRNIEHEWHAREPLYCGSEAGV